MLRPTTRQGCKVVYERPVVIDYGTLVELTQALTTTGGEDGLGKLRAHVGVSVVIGP
jgi:hypothetical protein